MGQATLRAGIAVAWLILGGSVGCSDKGGGTLELRCERLGTVCGDPAKRDKLVGECRQAAAQQTEKGCADKARAAYECYEQRLCGKGDKVWALDDFRVLAERQEACVAERDALRDCLGK